MPRSAYQAPNAVGVIEGRAEVQAERARLSEQGFAVGEEGGGIERFGGADGVGQVENDEVEAKACRGGMAAHVGETVFDAQFEAGSSKAPR